MNVDRFTVLSGKIWDLGLKIRVLEMALSSKIADPEYRSATLKEIDKLKIQMKKLIEERDKLKNGNT